MKKFKLEEANALASRIEELEIFTEEALKVPSNSLVLEIKIGRSSCVKTFIEIEEDLRLHIVDYYNKKLEALKKEFDDL
jgi:hypothetical protein